MVIESFLPGCKDKIYERFHQKGTNVAGRVGLREQLVGKGR